MSKSSSVDRTHEQHAAEVPATNQAAENQSTDQYAESIVEGGDTHVSGLALYALLGALLLVVIIITLDISILATAIPSLTNTFHTLSDIGWYGSAFMITNCALQPLAGRVYSFFPFKYSFLAFLSVFELGSLLCGVSASSTMLVVGRAVCGIGSSGLMNGALTIVGIAAPPSKRSVVMGLFISVSSLGQVIGPLIGGSLTQYVSWRWCFYLNLPIGAAAAVAIVFVKLPPTTAAGKDYGFKTVFRELDIAGFLVFGPACVMLLIALEWGGTVYAWSSATVIGLLAGSAVAFVVFGFWERTQGDRAMIPRSIVADRRIAGCCITAAFQGAAMLVLTYYLALWFQVVRGDSPVTSAVSTLPNFISQVLLALASSGLVMVMHYVLPSLLLGNTLVTVSYGLFSTFKPSTSTAQWIGYQLLAGGGRGMALQMPMIVVQAMVALPQMATVTAIVAWAQFLGGAVCISLAQTLFQNLLRSTLHTYVPQVDAGIVLTAGATGFTSVVPPQYHDGVRLAYNEAIAQTFYLGAGVAGMSVLASLMLGSAQANPAKNRKKAEMAEVVLPEAEAELMFDHAGPAWIAK